MQKRGYLVVFSLLVVSMFIIAGCKEGAIGSGAKKLGPVPINVCESRYNTQKNCVQDLGCIWSNGKCQYKPAPSLRNNGVVCITDNDCMSGLCTTLPGLSGKICQTAPIAPVVQKVSGQACVADADCQTGLTCQSISGVPGKICQTAQVKTLAQKTCSELTISECNQQYTRCKIFTNPSNGQQSCTNLTTTTQAIVRSCSQIINGDECAKSANCVYDVRKNGSCVEYPNKYNLTGCIDSDGGYDYLVSGTTIVDGFKYSDQCNTPENIAYGAPDLYEEGCGESGSIMTRGFKCKRLGEGYTCMDGKCVQP